MIYASVLLLILIAGLLFYALATNPKTARLGEIAFACALLAICLQVGTRAITLLGR